MPSGSRRQITSWPFTCAAKAAAITPVPGGVGRMTVAALMINTLMAYQNNFNLA